MQYSQKEIFSQCEEIGEPQVRERLNSGDWSHKERVNHAREWLRLQEESRNEDSKIEQSRIARSAKNAAWAAAIAAIIAAISAAISVYLSFGDN